MAFEWKFAGRIGLSVLVVGVMLFAAIAVMAPVTTGRSATNGHSFASAVVPGAARPAATCGQTPVALGSSSTYAALSGTSITNTGSSTLTGDIGVSPGTSVTGFPPGTYSGTKNVANTASAAAKLDLTTAYNDAAGRSNCAVTVAGNIGGQTLTPGLYKSTSSLAISSGDLTLSGGGNSNAVFIFQVASALTTTSGRAVILTNGAQAGNVFWQIGSSASLGTTSTMQGTILAYASITMTSGAQLNGRALARTADVTISSGTIVVPTTSASPSYDVTFTETGLMAGASWSVTMAGVLTSSLTTTIVSTLSNGAYAYTVGTGAGYTPSPASGSVTVSGGPVNQAIVFTAAAPGTTFAVTFSETGLAAGTSWSVTLKDAMLSSTTSTIVFIEINGTGAYTVSAASGYDVSPSSGSVTVTGAAVGKAITFTPSGSGDGGGSSPAGPSPAGIPTWEWAVIGVVALAAIAAVAAGITMARRRKKVA